jgi:predicted DsbA family dithiol-disulfide isomerase
VQPIKLTYYLEVISSWCYWAEPAWAELKARYAKRVDFQWKIAHMPPEAFPQSKAQADWFYRRSGTIMQSPFKLSSEWFEPGPQPYAVPSLVAEAAKDFKVTDDRVRLALVEAAVREGKKVGRWEVAVAVAAKAAKLDRAKLLKRAQSPEVKARTKAGTDEFNALKVDQRPTFLLESPIGDRAVFSGLVKVEPLAATLDAMLSDIGAYIAYAAHHGGPPPA